MTLTEDDEDIDGEEDNDEPDIAGKDDGDIGVEDDVDIAGEEDKDEPDIDEEDGFETVTWADETIAEGQLTVLIWRVEESDSVVEVNVVVVVVVVVVNGASDTRSNVS